GGGWSYGLQDLSEQEERQLTEFLEKTRPERDMDFTARNKDDRKLDGGIRSDDRKKGLDSYYEALEATKKKDKDKGGGGGNVKEMDSEPSKRGKPLTIDEAKKASEKLPAKVRNVPAITEAIAKPQPNVKFSFGGGDNSNTQFATLALWAARRH